jgi:membrane-associated phospholipid phosphatase
VLGLALAVAWRRPQVLALVAVADGAADLVAYVLKVVTGVERPAYRYAEPRPLVHVPHDGSFPSGHTATSFACATVLASFVPRAAPLLYVLALAIGFSRIYVGAHWPLDVVVGAVLGSALGVALMALARRARPTQSR